jgi:exosortase/archaeosortase family protein
MVSKSPGQKNGIYKILGIMLVLGLIFVLFRRLDIFNFVKIPFESIIKSIVWFDVKIAGLTDINQDAFKSPINLRSGTTLSFDIQYLMKKLFVAFLVIIWITPTRIKRKILASIAIFPLHYLAILVKILLIIFLCNHNFDLVNARSAGMAFLYFVYFLLIKYWISINPDIYLWIGKITRTSTEFIISKVRILAWLISILIIIEILLAIFELGPWIKFLFNTSHQILNLFNYNSIVDGPNLIGENGIVYMAKGCLGIRMTFIFAAFIFLTGENLRKKLIYILAGIVIINIVNILRFVFLFIHLQNHGEYLWKIEVHDMFNVIVYSIVFILWVIWLEWFTDIWAYLRTKYNINMKTEAEN